MKKYKYHYVYRITNRITNYHYYGSRSCNCLPSEDLGIKYKSHSKNKFFIQDQKDNPQDYKYKVIKIFRTERREAISLEVLLHKKFDVKNHPKFINRANQSSNGFDVTGLKLSNKQIENRRKHLIGRECSEETRKKIGDANRCNKISEEQKLAISKANKGRIHTAEARENMRKSKEKFKGKKREACIGKKISESKFYTVMIYNNNNELVYTVMDGFQKFCKENGLPRVPLEESYKSNGKPIYQNKTRKVMSKFEKFKGWYAVLVD